MISFVGAGPGDMELISAKGVRLLQEAEAVIYDRLVNPLLLFHTKPDCALIYVGKTPYQKTVSQETINQKLLATADKCSRIVRLKGGDPGIFGRLTEELAAVSSVGLPFEIVPGITAASGSAAYSGIPLTERGVARSVTMRTGHFKTDEAFSLGNIEAKQTICLYMGVEALAKFLTVLEKQGFSSNVPVAVISWGTFGWQQKTVGTIGSILAKVQQADIKNPAMIIVGEVVKNTATYDWFTKLPEFGETKLIVSTRPPKISELVEKTAQGAGVWWHQVGERRDRRFDEISQYYRNEHQFSTVVFTDEEAEDWYKKESGEIK